MIKGMKKVLIITLLTVFIAIFLFFGFDKNKTKIKYNTNYNNWDYIGNCISLNKDSIKQKSNQKTAIFHLYISDKCNSFTPENIDTDYVIVSYSALCGRKMLKTNNIKSYAIGNKLIKDKNFFFNHYKSYTEIPDGELYYNAICSIKKYAKKDTISFSKYLDLPKTDKDVLILNKQGDVILNNKIILTESGIPLNKNTAYSYSELKTLFTAQGLKPRKNCDPSDIKTNGILGCYMD